MFIPAGNNENDDKKILATAGIDKSFPFNVDAQLQLMYCNSPSEPDTFSTLYADDLSVSDLAFSRITAFTALSWKASPLVSLSPSLMLFPDLKGYYTAFSFDYSVAENTGLSLWFQRFRGTLAGNKSIVNLAFLRIKISF